MSIVKKITYFPIFWILITSCGQFTTADSEFTNFRPLTITNKSQFQLEEIRIHQNLEYLNSKNILKEKMEENESIDINVENKSYVTVIREKVTHGDMIAYTTAYPLNLRGSKRYNTLIV